MEQSKEYDQILGTLLDKWLEELKQVPVRMRDVDDMNWRGFLASADPSLSKAIEGHTREDIRNGLVKHALASAITEAILVAHKILEQRDTEQGT